MQQDLIIEYKTKDMTEQELIEKIALYNSYLEEGNKSPDDNDDYIIMIAALEQELMDLQND